MMKLENKESVKEMGLVLTHYVSKIPGNVVFETITLTYCHAVERAVERLLVHKIQPTDLLIGKPPDQKNQEYVDSLCQEKNIRLITKLIKSLRPSDIVLIGVYQNETE